MSDPRDSGEHVIKIGPADPLAKMAGADEFVHTPAATSRETHITLGHVLWTLTHNGSTAQARRWVTAAGFELQMQIWSGARVDGQEDLCWTQLFATDELLADTALAKKRQLEASGWLEDLEASAR